MADPRPTSEISADEGTARRRRWRLSGTEVDLVRSPLARRIVLLFVTCALLPTAAVALLSFTEVNRHLLVQSHARLRTTSKAAGMAIFERALLLDEELALYEKLTPASATTVGLLHGAAPTLPTGFEGIALRDPFGNVRALAGDVGRVPRLRRVERAHLAAGGTTLLRDFSGAAPALFIVRASSRDAAIQLVGRVSTRFMLGIPQEPGSAVAERLCVFETPDRVLHCGLPRAALTIEFPAERGRSGDVDWRGEDKSYVGSYWTLFLRGRFAAPEWRVLVAEPEAEVLAPIAAFRRQFPLVIVGVLCLVGLLSVRTIRRALIPLARLRKATRRIAERDFETRVEISSGDEFEELASSFNGMAERLRAQFEALGSAADNERVQRERAEEAARSKAQFLANMSHEIRTPMTAILGFADLMLDSTQSLEERDDCVATIRRNGQHLLGIINDILDVSRVESGELRVDQRAFDPRGLVREVADLLRPQARAKGLRLDVVEGDELPPTIASDRRRLKQILINLANNAIKFTERGRVRIEAKREVEPGQDRVRFAVVDTGVGLPADVQQRIFEPFWQVDSSTTREIGGTGLGLTIVRSLVELLGGAVTCESELGRGSRFHFAIDIGSADAQPAAASPEPQRVRATPQPAASVTGRVLLAEDGPDNQRLISHMLRKAGLEIEVVENGHLAWKRALEVLDSEPFDVILMDMQMPEMDGYEATRRLRADGYDRAIIALTAHALGGDREKCLAAGCNDYATKPVTRASLIELIEPHVEKRTPVE